MSSVKFRRHLDEQLRFSVTCYDSSGARQSLAGVSDLACTIETLDGAVVVNADHTHCSIDETDAATAGDVSYSRPPDGTTTFNVGTYRAHFRATIGGIAVDFPEDGYIALEFT